MLLQTALALALAFGQEAPPPAIHSICDISQQFSFYMDGRFQRQYLEGVGRDARNWGSLQRLDLENVNLLVLSPGDPRLSYSRAAIEHVDRFARDGGTLLLMLDGGESMPPAAELAARWGAQATVHRAREPLEVGGASIPSDSELSFRGGTVLGLAQEWQTLVRDAEQRPVLALRAYGKGWLLLGSRGLFGQRPDAADPINSDWVTPLLVELAKAKPIDATKPPRATWAEREREVGPLTLEFHEGTEPFADAIGAEYLRVRPHLVAITGVEPSPGMIKRLLILPTGGGGFSSGARIAIGAWWGGYPEERYPMVELIGHEAGHSWVLPHPEPLWNEPIATYLGMRVGERLELTEARPMLEQQIAAARRHDPELTEIDPLKDDAPRDLVWGKSFFVFEELERLHGPGALRKYFRAKRALLADARPGYSMDDCVAVWSRAVGEDLFPWFRSLAFSVSAERTELWPE